MKAAELMLRTRCFGGFFPAPAEGTNTHILSTGHQLKGGYVINRSVDEGAFRAMRAPIPGRDDNATQLSLQGVPDAIVQWEPKLSLGLYRELSEEQQRFVDRFLIVKPGTPSLKIEAPKKPRGKTGEAVS